MRLGDQTVFVAPPPLSLLLLPPIARLSFRPLSLLLPLLLVLVRPTAALLSCLTCIATPDSTQLDGFRVLTRLPRPACVMEPVVCEREQDVCATITMHMGAGEFWLGSGCERRTNFEQSPGGCETVRTTTKQVQLGYVHERRALQRVCVCTRDLCNRSTPPQHSTVVFSLPLLAALSLRVVL